MREELKELIEKCPVQDLNREISALHIKLIELEELSEAVEDISNEEAWNTLESVWNAMFKVDDKLKELTKCQIQQQIEKEKKLDVLDGHRRYEI